MLGRSAGASCLSLLSRPAMLTMLMTRPRPLHNSTHRADHLTSSTQLPSQRTNHEDALQQRVGSTYISSSLLAARRRGRLQANSGCHGCTGYVLLSLSPNLSHHRYRPSLVCWEGNLASAMASTSEGSVVLCSTLSHSCLPPSLPSFLAAFPRSLHQRKHPAGGIQVHP